MYNDIIIACKLVSEGNEMKRTVYIYDGKYKTRRAAEIALAVLEARGL